MNEAFALLSIAAYETGNEDVLDWALAEAKLRSVDVEPIEELAGERAPTWFGDSRP